MAPDRADIDASRPCRKRLGVTCEETLDLLHFPEASPHRVCTGHLTLHRRRRSWPRPGAQLPIEGWTGHVARSCPTRRPARSTSSDRDRRRDVGCCGPLTCGVPRTQPRAHSVEPEAYRRSAAATGRTFGGQAFVCHDPGDDDAALSKSSNRAYGRGIARLTGRGWPFRDRGRCAGRHPADGSDGSGDRYAPFRNGDQPEPGGRPRRA